MTIDLLSGGRLELGLGAGWLKDEYEAVGLTMDSPGTRISRLEDVIHAIKQYSNDGEIDLTNETINWHEFEGCLSPFKRRIPLL